tara:strand:+ start:55 stop:501 length:447 start_codon:yes stop_codon:yes gene_type:complete
MMLSKNFSLAEMLKSSTADRKGIPNNPTADDIYNLGALAVHILQPLRNEYGAFIVSSGYRSPELCVAIGSNTTSQHAKGQAADFEIPGISNYDLAEWIEDNLEFDQLILECYKGGNTGWVHCSYIPDGRKESLTYDRTQGYRKGLLEK